MICLGFSKHMLMAHVKEKLESTMLIGMALVEEYVATVLLSGRLKDESPVSTVLIAAPESGKTSVVLARPCKSALPLTDVTGRGLMLLCQQQKEVTHFILNDLVAIMSHKQTVNAYTLSIINAMTEEGIQAVAFPGVIEQYSHGKRGIIACTTTDLFRDKRHWWWKIGLASRLLPFGFDHSSQLQVRIKALIQDETRHNGKQSPLKVIEVPDALIRVIIPTKFKAEILKISDTIARRLEDPKGYRRLHQFQSLAKAHSLRRSWKNPQVTEEDIEFLYRIDPYVSYTETHLL